MGDYLLGQQSGNGGSRLVRGRKDFRPFSEIVHEYYCIAISILGNCIASTPV